MVDNQKISKIISERKKAHINDPDIENKYWIPMIEALGDNENDVIKYLSTIDDETFSWISEIYEEIVSKFPSKDMENVFKRVKQIS